MQAITILTEKALNLLLLMTMLVEIATRTNYIGQTHNKSTVSMFPTYESA